MKRSPLRTYTQMSRSTPLKKRRSKPRRTLREIIPEHLDFVREKPCCVCGAPGPSHPHHLKTRKAGGSDRQVAPLCCKHHTGPFGIHVLGPIRFAEMYRINLDAVAKHWWSVSPYRATTPPVTTHEGNQ